MSTMKYLGSQQKYVGGILVKWQTILILRDSMVQVLAKKSYD